MLMDVEDGGEGAVPTPLMLRRSWHNGFFQPPGNYANLNRAISREPSEYDPFDQPVNQASDQRPPGRIQGSLNRLPTNGTIAGVFESTTMGGSNDGAYGAYVAQRAHEEQQQQQQQQQQFAARYEAERSIRTLALAAALAAASSYFRIPPEHMHDLQRTRAFVDATGKAGLASHLAQEEANRAEAIYSKAFGEALFYATTPPRHHRQGPRQGGQLGCKDAREDTGSGVYHPHLNVSHYVNPKGMGTTNTISRAELAAIAAAVIHAYSHIATDSLTPLHQIKKRLSHPILHRHHIQGDVLQSIAEAVCQSPSPIHFFKDKSHAGIIGNEYADALAKKSATTFHDIADTFIRTAGPQENPFHSIHWLAKEDTENQTQIHNHNHTANMAHPPPPKLWYLPNHRDAL